MSSVSRRYRGDTFVSTLMAMRCNLGFLDPKTVDVDVFGQRRRSCGIYRPLLWKECWKVRRSSGQSIDVDDRGASDGRPWHRWRNWKAGIASNFEGAVVEEDGALESKVGHHAETRSTASSTDSCPKSILVRSALPTAYAYVAHHCQCFSHRSRNRVNGQHQRRCSFTACC